MSGYHRRVSDALPADDGRVADDAGGTIVGPWRRKSRRTIYENPWIRVDHDEVTRPNGRGGIYGVVHFHNLAVGVVVLDDTERVLLVGQFRYALNRYSWEIPEGGVPFDEDPLAGAKRELAEETGFSAATWQEIARFELSNSVTDEHGFLYLATDVTTGVAAPDETEAIDVEWVPFDEALAMIDRGDITDAMSQIGLDRVARLRSLDKR